MSQRMRSPRAWLVVALAVCSVGTAMAVAAGARSARNGGSPRTVLAGDIPGPTDPKGGTDCSLRYVAQGDGVVKGTDNSSKSYANELQDNQLVKVPGPWCMWNTSDDPVTTDDYVNNGQQALASSLDPRLITLTLGRQNSTIVDHVKDCLQDIKDHQFIQANTCALNVLAASSDWTKLAQNLDTIMQQYKVQQDGDPRLVVAVTGYFNPYPAATDVVTKVPEFCADLIDTIPTCLARWFLLPPALVTLDQVVQKLNTTIQNVVSQFTEATQGRMVFVNPYDAFKDHCTKMDVTITINVYHPTNDPDQHQSEKDFGCSTPWIASDGNDGTLTPFPYLTPAINGVLLLARQTTTGMGINPNDTGHTCIADLIWEAVKQKLGVAQAPVSDPCSSL